MADALLPPLFAFAVMAAAVWVTGRLVLPKRRPPR